MSNDLAHWNYRIIRHTTNKNIRYAIHEVFYSDAMAKAVAIEESFPMGETVKELREDLQLMLKAFNHPPLDMDEFEKAK